MSHSNNSLVLSYLTLRKAIGIIGIALPFVLVLGNILLDSSGLQSSISSYYYTIMRDVFVGSLVVIGVFLMSYRGYDRKDYIAGKLAGFFALATALLPTAPDNGATLQQVTIGNIHLLAAACYFLILAYFALVLFRKTNPSKPPTRKKLQRNKVYLICGSTMLICLLGVAMAKLILEHDLVHSLNIVFWLESVAIIVFGVSWFVKGEAILKDEVNPDTKGTISRWH